jgi:hypothetical protein
MTIIDDLLSIVSGKPVKGSVLDIFGKPGPTKWVVVVNRDRARPPATANRDDRPGPSRPDSASG